MKIRYYAEIDSLYIELLSDAGADVVSISDDIRVDVNASGRAVGIDFDNASRYYDVTNLEATGIPAIHMTLGTPTSAATAH